MGVAGDNFNEIALIQEAKDIDKINGSIQTVRRQYGDIIKPLFNLLNDGHYYDERKPRVEDSPYLVKPFRNKNNTNLSIEPQHVYRAFTKMTEMYNEAHPHNNKFLTPATVLKSGLFYELYKIEQIKGALIKDDYDSVAEVYNYSIAYSTFMRDYEIYKDVFWKPKKVEKHEMYQKRLEPSQQTTRMEQMNLFNLPDELEMLTFDATDEEWETIKKNAAVAGLGVNDYIVKTALSN